MVVTRVIREAGLRVRRRHDGRHTEPELAEVGRTVPAPTAVGHDRRPDVVEEAAPLVVGQHEQATLPLRRLRERLEHARIQSWPVRMSPTG